MPMRIPEYVQLIVRVQSPGIHGEGQESHPLGTFSNLHVFGMDLLMWA